MIKKLYALLSSLEKKQLRLLLIIMIIGALMDAMGVAVFFPFIALLKDPSIIHNYPEIQSYLELFGISEEKKILITFASGLIIFFIIKNIFITFINYRQFNFTYKSQVKLAQRLYKKYINNEYEFHIKTNASELLRNLKENSFWIFSSILYPILIIVTELFVITFILILLLFLSPIITIYVITAYISIGFIFYTVIKSKSKHYGKRQQESIKDMNKWITQGLNGIKDIKLHQNEDLFLTKFSHYSNKYAQNNIFQKTIDSLPKQILETLLMVGIALAAIFIVNSGQNILDNLPIISLFAFSAIKLMPSANRIMSALSNIKFYSSALDIIYREFSQDLKHNQVDEESITKTQIDFKNRIKLTNIYYKYPESSQYSIKMLSLNIAKGEFIGITGASGCGKSTLVDIVSGLLEPTDGEIKVDSIQINNTNMDSWQKKIRYIPQFVYLLDDSIENNIVFGCELYQNKKKRLFESIKMAGLKEYVNSLSKGIYTNIGEHGVKLSGGQKQRIGIARALYYNAEVLIFDETTSALDAITEENIMNTINNLNNTIIVITHRLSTIKSADKIFFMESGNIVNTGTFDELNHSNDVFSKMVKNS